MSLAQSYAFGGRKMTTLTVGLPDDTTQRLNSLVRRRARALAAWDTENHFRTIVATGYVAQALTVLDRLDADERQATGS